MIASFDRESPLEGKRDNVFMRQVWLGDNRSQHLVILGAKLLTGTMPTLLKGDELSKFMGAMDVNSLPPLKRYVMDPYWRKAGSRHGFSCAGSRALWASAIAGWQRGWRRIRG